MPRIRGSVIRKVWPSVTIVLKNGKTAYCVDGRPTAGRKYFAEKAEALALAEDLGKLKADGGVLALTMPASLSQDALEAAEILMPWKCTLSEAAKHYVAFLKADQAKANAITVEAAVDDYLANKRHQAARGEISPQTVSKWKVNWASLKPRLPIAASLISTKAVFRLFWMAFTIAHAGEQISEQN